MNYHTKAVIAYQRKFPERFKANRMAQKYPHLLRILSECPHLGEKEKHHPDYSKWRQVHLLCHACHVDIHKKLRHEKYGRGPDLTALPTVKSVNKVQKKKNIKAIRVDDRSENMKLPKLKCLRCGHEWIPRIEDVVRCPNCGNVRWNEKPKETKEFPPGSGE